MGTEDGRTRSNCWSHIEEVFLVGAVMERWWTRGSLAAARIGNVNNDSCWDEIKENYDNNWQKLENKSRPAERSANALSRHFKVMKTRISTPSEETKTETFESFYLEWETQYNRESSLMLNTIQQMIKEGKLFPEYSLVRKNDERNVAQSRKKRVFSSTHPVDSFEHNEYYNTVHGSNGVIMARQLKQELNLFNRHPHQLSNTPEGHGQQARSEHNNQVHGNMQGVFQGGMGSTPNRVEERKLEFPNVHHFNDNEKLDVQIVSGLFDMFGIESNNQNHGQTNVSTNNGKFQETYKTEEDTFPHHDGNLNGNANSVQHHLNGVGRGHRNLSGANAHDMGLGMRSNLQQMQSVNQQKDDSYLHTVSGADAAKMAQQLRYEREHHRRSAEVARVHGRQHSKRRLVDPNPTTVFDHFRSVENEFVNPPVPNGSHKSESMHFGGSPIESKGNGDSFSEKHDDYAFQNDTVNQHVRKDAQAVNGKLNPNNNTSHKKQGWLNPFFGRRSKPDRNKR